MYYVPMMTTVPQQNKSDRWSVSNGVPLLTCSMKVSKSLMPESLHSYHWYSCEGVWSLSWQPPLWASHPTVSPFCPCSIGGPVCPTTRKSSEPPSISKILGEFDRPFVCILLACASKLYSSCPSAYTNATFGVVSCCALGSVLLECSHHSSVR